MRIAATKLFLCLFCLMLFSMEAQAAEVNLSVAASLRDVINGLSDSFARQNTGVIFLKNFGGSGALAKQIENGAPADIFISANMKWMDYLNGKKLVAVSSMGTFAYNTLVFAGTADKKLSVMQDLAGLEKIAIGSPKSVPAGEYAMEAMKKSGIDGQLQSKLVMAKDVRDCLMYAERGEVDGSFVYKTDALQAKRAKIIFVVPQGLYPRVVYPMALTTAGAKKREALAFFRYLQSGDAKRVLGRFGFALQ